VKARFTRPFGQYKPGDEIELPAGAEFDHEYLSEVKEPKAKAEAPKEGDK
jgi:hypothetical protein